MGAVTTKSQKIMHRTPCQTLPFVFFVVSLKNNFKDKRQVTQFTFLFFLSSSHFLFNHFVVDVFCCFLHLFEKRLDNNKKISKIFKTSNVCSVIEIPVVVIDSIDMIIFVCIFTVLVLCFVLLLCFLFDASIV